jgi:hypothetical protein
MNEEITASIAASLGHADTLAASILLAACRAFCTNIRQMVKMLSICSICKHLRRVCSDKRHLGSTLKQFVARKKR